MTVPTSRGMQTPLLLLMMVTQEYSEILHVRDLEH